MSIFSYAVNDLKLPSTGNRPRGNSKPFINSRGNWHVSLCFIALGLSWEIKTNLISFKTCLFLILLQFPGLWALTMKANHIFFVCKCILCSIWWSLIRTISVQCNVCKPLKGQLKLSSIMSFKNRLKPLIGQSVRDQTDQHQDVLLVKRVQVECCLQK